jgi:hypothetical protein
MPRMRSMLIAGVALASITAGCSSSAKSSTPSTTGSKPTTRPSTPVTSAPIPAPAGLPAFYSVPQPLPSTNGKLLKSEKVAAPDVHGTVYRVMYVSQSVSGKYVAVTGLIVVPNGTAPKDGFPVVSWAHGTDGMADQCAPSLKPASNAPLANFLLDKGWVVTATDYEGEGTPGLHPYIAGINAARNTIDIVRAAREMSAVHASDHYVVWGHSQGGHTAMFALTNGPAYAPDLKLEGVVAGAPPSQFALLYNFLKAGPFRHYLLMAAGGLNAAYGDAAPLDEVLTPEGIKLLPELDKGCAGYVAEKVADVDIATVTKVDPFTVPKWQKVLKANDPQYIAKASPVPLLIIHGGIDEQIPEISSRIVAGHLCSLGQVLQRWVYPGQSHAGVIAPSIGDMSRWIADRFAGGPNPDPYKPVGLPDVGTTTCPT